MLLCTARYLITIFTTLKGKHVRDSAKFNYCDVKFMREFLHMNKINVRAVFMTDKIIKHVRETSKQFFFYYSIGWQHLDMIIRICLSYLSVI
jgi:hypothetical protein